MTSTSAPGSTRAPAEGAAIGVDELTRRRFARGLVIGAVVVALFAVLPLLDVPVPVLLPGSLASSGTLLVLAGLALLALGLHERFAGRLAIPAADGRAA